MFDVNYGFFSLKHMWYEYIYISVCVYLYSYRKFSILAVVLT